METIQSYEIKPPVGYKLVETIENRIKKVSFEKIEESKKELNDYLADVLVNKRWYYINDYNEIESLKYEFSTLSSLEDLNLKTKDECIKDQLHNELRLLQKHPNIDGIEVKDICDKWYFFFNFKQDTISCTSCKFLKSNDIYFSSKEAAEKALKVFGEEKMIKYLTL